VPKERKFTKAYIKDIIDLKKLTAIIIFLILAVPLYAQTTDKEDVKVGLVLSGGGAKGFAHIGVLKAIEEAGVRIDYIAGTSMGAIVGALYASGFSAKELDSIFRKVNFNKIIQDEIPRGAKTLYEKEDQERYALTLPFDNFKVKFPSAISRGQNVYNLLARLTQHVRTVKDFKKLPIPFFCIATDIETGEAVVLDEGYLPEAISASGAFPSLFEPVEIDGKLLLDGGIVNNYPIFELKKKGVDIIIGVDVQDDLSDRKRLTSATDILFQINNYRTVNDMKLKAKATDIYIKPDIEPFSVISFEEGADIIKRGELAGREKINRLKALAERQSKHKSREITKIKDDSLLINKVSFEGNDRYTRAYLKGKLRLRLDEKISYEKFNQGINNLSATNNFSAIRYRLMPNENGNELIMKIKEKDNRTFLRLGVHYDALYQSAAMVNITQKQLLFDDDVASLDLILGDNLRYNFEYYLDKGFYWSFGMNSRYNSFSKDVSFELLQQETNIPDLDVERLEVEVKDFTNQIYVQTLIREEFAFGIGLEHKYLRYESATVQENSENLIFENSNIYSTFGFLKLDTYDNKFFPKKGVFFDGDFHLYLYSTDFINAFDQFSIGKAKFGFATPLANKITFNFETEGGFTLGNGGYNSLDFLLGGYANNLINNFIPFYGYDFISFGGDSFVKSLFIFDYEFLKKNHLVFAANYSNAADDIFESGEWFSTPDFSGYAVGYGLETLLGPIELKYTWSPENKARWFFNLGFWF
jgi:NTE family protein